MVKLFEIKPSEGQIGVSISFMSFIFESDVLYVVSI